MGNQDVRRVEGFDFLNLHPGVFFGTTSDRYAGWIGQIYTDEKYRGRISSRTKVLGGKTYYEEVLPVDSVTEYFEHFPVLEIDFTFYRPLVDKEGKPTTNHRVLSTYSRYLKKEDRIILKVPQGVFARKIRKGKAYQENHDYLDPLFFERGFYRPAVEILGACVGGFIFEQEYQRKNESVDSAVLADDLDRFFKTVPDDSRYHVEIRTERLLDERLFQVLKNRGVGLVYSHWTWLPRLADQAEKSGGPFNRAGDQIVRLLTPRGMNYAQTFEETHPFDRLREDMLRDDMIEDTVEIIRGVVHRGKRIYVLINNRLAGNAPLTARMIAERLADRGI